MYGSLQSHGMPWTSWKECTVPSRVMECLGPAGRSVRFPPESWNALYRTSCHLNRTNNYLAAWIKKFAVQIGHAHPTIWNFMAADYMEQSLTEEKFIFEHNGDEPPRRKKRNVTRDRRINHLVESYYPNQDNLITYLDSLRDVMVED